MPFTDVDTGDRARGADDGFREECDEAGAVGEVEDVRAWERGGPEEVGGGLEGIPGCVVGEGASVVEVADGRDGHGFFGGGMVD